MPENVFETVLNNILSVFDFYGYLIVLAVFLVSLLFQILVKTTFSRYSKIPNSARMTGAEAAELVMRQNGVAGIPISRVEGELTDHYDPKAKVIYLSESVYSASSVAAIGVAAHEAGHAVQHETGYFPVRIRSAIIPVTNIGSRLSTPLFFLGLILGSFPLAIAGVILFGLCVVFQLVTLPVEFNASRRAVTVLGASGRFSESDLKGARKTLWAAAMTYVAALVVALTQFLRLLAIASSGRRRR